MRGFLRIAELAKNCGRLWGKSRPREPGLGTGRVGRDRGRKLLKFQREAAVAVPARGSPSDTQALGSDCDCRFTKR